MHCVDPLKYFQFCELKVYESNFFRVIRDKFLFFFGCSLYVVYLQGYIMISYLGFYSPLFFEEYTIQQKKRPPQGAMNDVMVTITN